MNTDYLKEFLAVARLKSFSEAANELYMTQSSVSRHILTLEKDLDVPLFARTSRLVSLTAYGKLFIPRAEKILEELRQFEESTNEVRRRTHERESTVRIAALPSFINSSWKQVDRFLDLSGVGLRYQVYEVEAVDMEKMLMEKECDFATVRTMDISSFYSFSENMDYILMEEEPYAIVLPKSHPFAGRDEVSLYDLRDESYIMPDSRTLLREPCFELCRNAGFIPKVKYEFHNRRNCLEMISRGFGISFAPAGVLERFPFDNLAAIRIEPQIITRLYLARNTTVEMTDEKQYFWNRMKGYIDYSKSGKP